MNATPKPQSPSSDLSRLDALTGGAFKAPTSGERAARLRDWLVGEPSAEAMAEVYRELAHRDKGAAKALKEKLDELKRVKAQDAIAEEWAARARVLLEQGRFNLADAMGWQRDAAKAGAPLSREPLAGLRQTLNERMKALEDLQHRLQVQREAAVLLAQRIELFSTKAWAEAQALRDGLQADVGAWQTQAAALADDAAWPSLEPKHPQQLETSRSQLALVWEAFDAALALALAAAADPQAPLPAVPVWADELRAGRGQAAPAIDSAEVAARQAQATQALTAALTVLNQELAQGHSKTAPKAAALLRQVHKDHARHIDAALEAQVQAALLKSSELEGWQRWRADQLREELLAKAVALSQAPEGQRPGGRKVQEALRQLREQWKATDQGGAPNHALWKKFDQACNEAHQIVEAWLGQLKQQNEAHRAQRLELIHALQAWTLAHADSQDWKQQLRDLHAFAERWRQAGNLSEKLFAELQPPWKAAMAAAYAGPQAAQEQSIARRQALIEEAQALGQMPALRVDAVKALQQRWQQEAQALPLDRRQEQKLWEAFRQPIDAAFERKTAEREQVAASLGAHDQAVLQAAQALEAACAAGDAARIRSASEALQACLRGQAPAAVPPQAAKPDLTAAGAEASPDSNADSGASTTAPEATGTPTEADEGKAPAAAPAAAAPRKLVAMRGDDRPGMARAQPQSGRPGAGRDERRGAREAGLGQARAWAPQRPDWRSSEREERGPRLGDAAFRAQRQALEQAELALKKLAAQAHGEALLGLLGAWQQRRPEAMPSVQALGGKAAAAARAAWAAALTQPASAAAEAARATHLLRLEMGAELPTPASHLEARRALQLQLLTRRHDPAPAQTWAQDVAQVLASPYDAAAAERLQAVLKLLLRR